MLKQGELWDENTGGSDFQNVISVLPWDNPFSIRGEGTKQNWGRLAGEGLKQLHGTGWGSTHKQDETKVKLCLYSILTEVDWSPEKEVEVDDFFSPL